MNESWRSSNLPEKVNSLQGLKALSDKQCQQQIKGKNFLWKIKWHIPGPLCPLVVRQSNYRCNHILVVHLCMCCMTESPWTSEITGTTVLVFALFAFDIRMHSWHNSQSKAQDILLNEAELKWHTHSNSRINIFKSLAALKVPPEAGCFILHDRPSGELWFNH